MGAVVYGAYLNAALKEGGRMSDSGGRRGSLSARLNGADKPEANVFLSGPQGQTQTNKEKTER